MEKNQSSVDIQLTELKGLTVKHNETAYCCVHSEDIAEYVAYIKSAQLIKNGGDKSEWTVNLLEEIVGFWSSNLHLKAFYLIENMFDFLCDVKQSVDFTVTEQKASKVLNLRMYGIIAFHVKISEKHSAKISLGKCKTMIDTLLLYKFKCC